MVGISIVIPVFNEEKSLINIINRLRQALIGLPAEFEIIAVDDGSTDQSAQLLENTEGLTVVRHIRNKGYGASLKTGIKHSRFDWVLIIDADSTYAPENLNQLISKMDEFDQIIGCRTTKINAIPYTRKHAKLFLNHFASYVSGKKVPDLNSGFRLFKKEIALRFWKLFPERFSFTSTLTMVSLTNGYDTCFVPIDYHPRKGRSSIRPTDFFNFLKLITKLSLFFKPFKIFAPISLLVLLFPAYATLSYALGFSTVFYDTTTIILFATSLQIFFFGLLAEIIIYNK